ncbi:creatininase family protein [Tateyamaria sp.]|uniref:creatininase family protein n=1 Tax=Tateyamaria sp. TaxID=1929288 RepID=UPI003B21428B
MSGVRDWQDFTASDFDDIDPLSTIAILPTAAVEQHGPHLPLGTDAMINNGLLSQLKATAPDDLDVRVLPLQAVGKSNEHLWAAGTLTLGAETAIRLWTEIGLSVARAGVRKLLILNSHGGNADVISIVARELRVQAGMYVVRGSWGASGAPDGLFSAQEMTHGIHGGDYETPLMLHLRPDTVDMAKAQDFRSAAEDAVIPPTGAMAFGWIASDLNPHGAVGEAHLATAEKGRLTANKLVSDMTGILQTMRNVSLDGFAPVDVPF